MIGNQLNPIVLPAQEIRTEMLRETSSFLRGGLHESSKPLCDILDVWQIWIDIHAAHVLVLHSSSSNGSSSLGSLLNPAVVRN